MILASVLASGVSAAGDTLYVSTTGNDANPGTFALPWATVQKACSTAAPGSTVLIRGGVYNEKVRLTVSGSATLGPITLMPEGQDSVILDGTGFPGQNMILLENRSHVRIRNLTLRNNSGVTDGSGVRIEGSGEGIVIAGMLIEHMRGSNAMGITVYGTDPVIPVSGLRIDSNIVRFCQPAPSEAITLNGNVEGFSVTGNIVQDVNNIGIDCIGGEGMCPAPAQDRARRGTVRGNRVVRARSSYGGGYAAGIYVDGGALIVVENNTVEQCDQGIEVGCENRGVTAESVVVRNNIIFNNDKRGLAFGGYDYPRTGRVRACAFTGNTIVRNDVLGTDDGEISIEYALDCLVRGNIVVSTSQDVLLRAETGTAQGNRMDYNVWHAPGGPGAAQFTWGGVGHAGWTGFRTATGQEAEGKFGDPLFADEELPSPDFHIRPGSPAEDAGDPGYLPSPEETDLDAEPRVVGMRADAGADEIALPPDPPALLSPADGMVDVPPRVRCIWRRAPRADGYDVRIGNDSAFSVILYEGAVHGDTTLMTTMLPSGGSCHWSVRAGNTAGAGAWSAASDFSISAYALGGCTVDAGWNLVALPLVPFDSAAASVFERALSPPFRYGPAGYAPVSSLRRDAGYWVKFPAADTITVAGVPWMGESVQVTPGWNIVGFGTGFVDASSVVQIPPGILQTSFFGYDGGYTAADTLTPGAGYWVRSAGEGVLAAPPALIHRPHPR